MISYTKRNVNLIAFILTTIIFILSQFFQYIISNNNFYLSILNPFYKNSIQVKFKESNQQNYNNTNNELSNIKEEYKENNSKQNNEEIWKIEIPAISLVAQIREGTTQEVLDKYVGHFTETYKMQGNIGLAAHNRGHNVNYFARLKELKRGDEIYYQYKSFKTTYVVEEHIIIEDTNWSYLEDTKENILTLITCVENEPNYRRCIQAVENKEG